jgi:osmotically-inducible protein OsmY
VTRTFLQPRHTACSFLTRLAAHFEEDVMTTADNELQERIERELTWDPEVTADHVGVTVKDGVVGLNGFVPTYAERMAAERAALRVQGTRAVANDLAVKLSTQRIDPDIAMAAANALRHNLSVPASVKVTVRDGYLTLEGTCEWWFQRNAAEQTVRYLPGVKGVTNAITIVPRISPRVVKDGIEAALKRNAEIDARRIAVTASGGTVTLAGYVHSHAERAEAARAAWAAPGVSVVENHIVVAP